MTASDTKIRLARQAIASHEAKLATAADKDTVRRQIAAAKTRLRHLTVEREGL